MTKKNKHTPAPAPVTREVVRTPASAKLAGIVRELDAALMEEFGPVWFAYSIMGGDGLVAASNASDGFVPPVVAAGTGAGGDTSSERKDGRRDE